MNYYFKKMNVRVHFFLRGKESALIDRPCAIYATVMVEGEKSTPFSTKLKVPAKYWMARGDKKITASSSENLVSPSFNLASNLNDHLTSIRKFAYEAGGILTAMDMPVTPDAIKEMIVNPKPVAPVKRFIEVVDELRVSLVQMGRKRSTMLTYRTRRNNVWGFFQDKNLTKMNIAGFKFRQFEQLRSWMAEQKNDDESSRFGKNTINKHLTMVNQVLDYAVNKEYIKSNPIGKLYLEYDPTKPPQYLEADARQRIYDCKLSTLEKERDVAIFLMNTGLSYTDYLSLADEHLMRLPSGQWFIKKSRDKSVIYSIIPLLSQAHEILDKYQGVKNLPKLDIADFNKTLKILGEACTAPFSLSTSTFRETFSSMMENEYMIPDRLLMFMMGHSNPRQLNNYSAVMPSRILHELNKNNIVIPFNIEAFKEFVKAS